MTETNKQNVPALRFPEFLGAWKTSAIADIASVTSGGTPNRGRAEYWGGEINWITTGEIKGGAITSAVQKITNAGLENSSAKLFPKGAVLIAMYGQGKTRGRSAILTIEAATNQACAAIIAKSGTAPEYILHNLTSRYDELRELANDGAQKNLSGGLIKTLKISSPSLPEQEKIARFLSVVDRRIEHLDRKRELLQHYKKGMMQKLFSRELRFKDKNGNDFPDWEEKPLNWLLSEPKERNRELNFSKTDVLSVSGVFGCINQIEFMGRSYAGVSVKDYHIVRHGDIVYTKSPLKKNPYGIIKANKGRDGIVSTLYAVYRPTKEADSDYLDYYFQLDDNLNRYLRPIVRKGAKNDMKVNNSDVLRDSIWTPHPDEQQKIAAFLSSLDRKIELVTLELTHAKAFKKGLLQQMFV